MIQMFENFPSSYNQILMQGAADYCDKVLRRLNDEKAEHCMLLLEIRRLVSQVEALYFQYSGDGSSSFALLDLSVVEDRFELIQEKAASLGIFPRLHEVPVTQLFAG